MNSVVHRFLLAQEFRLLIAVLVLAPVPWLMEYGQDHALLADRYLLQEFHSDEGLAAFVWIPEFVKPALAERGFRVCESESVAEEMPSLQVQCFDTRLGGALHADIRREGGGLHHYDDVAGALRFSSSDGSHPAGNGRVYLLSVPWGATRARTMAAVACQTPLALFAYVLARKRVWPWVREGCAAIETGIQWILARHAVVKTAEWIRKRHAVVKTGIQWILARRAVVKTAEWIRKRDADIKTGIVLVVLVLLAAAISMEACLR